MPGSRCRPSTSSELKEAEVGGGGTLGAGKEQTLGRSSLARVSSAPLYPFPLPEEVIKSFSQQS